MKNQHENKISINEIKMLKIVVYTFALAEKTYKLLKCRSAVNCQIMEPAVVNYRGNFGS